MRVRTIKSIEVNEDEFPTLAGARRALRADLLDRRAVEKCCERAGDLGLVADAEIFARTLAALPRTRDLLARRSLPAAVVVVVDGYLVVDTKRIARVWRVGQEGVVVERTREYAEIPDVIIAAALAPVVVTLIPDEADVVPVGIAFLDSDRLYWSRGADDWHVDLRARADAIISAARFFPDDDTRSLLLRCVEIDAGDRTAYRWLKELVAQDVAAGRYRSAVKALQVLHKLDSRDADVLELIAASFEVAGATDRARALSDEAKRIRATATPSGGSRAPTSPGRPAAKSFPSQAAQTKKHALLVTSSSMQSQTAQHLAHSQSHSHPQGSSMSSSGTTDRALPTRGSRSALT